MYTLIYFDVEDFISPQDSPAHSLPGQMADILRRHGLTGCFHLHGEKARYLERQRKTKVIAAIRKHDISLHFDRGSIHPTTAEEVSGLDWFRGVDRVLFREQPGFQALERIFGKCSGLTQHGGTFASQIVYAAGRMGKPFFYSPFRLPGRNVVWFCNNLLIGGYQADFYFDRVYRDTPQFDAALAKVGAYLEARAKSFDYTAMFGCHPVITIMEKFPDVINFLNGASPKPEHWIPPTLIKGVSIPLILGNFERLVETLARHPGLKWTTVAGIHELYGNRPVQVRDADVRDGAREVLRNAGPAYTSLLSAGELLVLLAQRALRRTKTYAVPMVCGPTDGPGRSDARMPASSAVPALARSILEYTLGCGYLPPMVKLDRSAVSLEAALVLLAGHAVGARRPRGNPMHGAADAIPGMSETMEQLKSYKLWHIHGSQYRADAIMKHFRLQCWTLKPAFTRREYPKEISVGRC